LYSLLFRNPGDPSSGTQFPLDYIIRYLSLEIMFILNNGTE
jgi:hypothetical protein